MIKKNYILYYGIFFLTVLIHFYVTLGNAFVLVWRLGDEEALLVSECVVTSTLFL